MRNKTVLWTVMWVLLLLATLGIPLTTPASGSRSTWLYYDDDYCGAHGCSLWEPDLTPLSAVRFTDIGPCDLLQKVKYYIAEGNASPDYSFRLHIMDSNWVDIYMHEYTPSDTGWNTIDISGEGIIVSGQFIVGMERYNYIEDPQNPDNYLYLPDLCSDMYEPGTGHSYWWRNYPDGSPSVDDRDYLIRAQIQPYVSCPTLTQWGLIILVVLIVFSTWVVLRRRKVIPSKQSSVSS